MTAADCSGDAATVAGCECLVGCPGDGISQGCSFEFPLGGVDWDRYRNSDQKAEDRRWTDLRCLTKGESAGSAALSLRWGIPPRKMDRRELQRTLIDHGVEIGRRFRTIPSLA